MKLKSFLSLSLLLIVLFLTACQGGGGLPALNSPGATITPASGKAVLTGKAVNMAGKVITQTPVRLAEIHRQGDQGAFVIDAAQSPSAMTDDQGFFTFQDVPPAEYLIVIGFLEENTYAIYQDDQGKPHTYTLQPDQKIDIGTMKVNFSR